MALFYLELKRRDREETFKQIEELKQMVELLMGEVEVVQDDSIKGSTIVKVKYDADAIERRLNRKAGRRQAVLHAGDWNIRNYESVSEFQNAEDRKTYVSLEELEQRIKEKGAKAVAEELEVSRATLFRKLKKARETGSDIVK